MPTFSSQWALARKKAGNIRQQQKRKRANRNYFLFVCLRRTAAANKRVVRCANGGFFPLKGRQESNKILNYKKKSGRQLASVLLGSTDGGKGGGGGKEGSHTPQ